MLSKHLKYVAGNNKMKKKLPQGGILASQTSWLFMHNQGAFCELFARYAQHLEYVKQGKRKRERKGERGRERQLIWPQMQ